MRLLITELCACFRCGISLDDVQLHLDKTAIGLCRLFFVLPIKQQGIHCPYTHRMDEHLLHKVYTLSDKKHVMWRNWDDGMFFFKGQLSNMWFFVLYIWWETVHRSLYSPQRSVQSRNVSCLHKTSSVVTSWFAGHRSSCILVPLLHEIIWMVGWCVFFEPFRFFLHTLLYLQYCSRLVLVLERDCVLQCFNIIH